MNEQNQQSPEQTIAIQGMQLQAAVRQRNEANDKLVMAEANLSMMQNQTSFMDAVLTKFKAKDEEVFNATLAEVQEEMKARQAT